MASAEEEEEREGEAAECADEEGKDLEIGKLMD